eukprot:GDKI01012984.1.p1 GENE.GDKI01012984.1~~GDKI01012984.1.p1  ORF type:complete len:325 (+),score=47.54 GDKI01012984.1:167-1141(+)
MKFTSLVLCFLCVLSHNHKNAALAQPNTQQNTNQDEPQTEYVWTVQLLDDKERNTLNEYDTLFEKHSLFCNGRWLNVPVLQDPMDLMMLQDLVVRIRPKVVIETGTYKGGLPFFFASVLELSGLKDSKVLTVDRNRPEDVWDLRWFCKTCPECTKPWTQPLWHKYVSFYQGWSDQESVVHDVAQDVTKALQETNGQGPIFVTLDAAHEYDGVSVELLLYAPLVTVGSYLVVQDVKLDGIWGKPGPRAAAEEFLSSYEDFEWDRSIEYYAYTQHMYLRRVSGDIGSLIPVADSNRKNARRHVIEEQKRQILPGSPVGGEGHGGEL